MPPQPANSNELCTIIVRLRRVPGSDSWRGQAISVQTGTARPLSLASSDDALTLAAALLPLLASAAEDPEEPA